MVGRMFDELELGWEDEENLSLVATPLYDFLVCICGLATLGSIMLRPLLKWHSLFH
jgi:hypothetical protein